MVAAEEDFGSKTLTVRYQPAAISLKQILQAVEKQGYQAKPQQEPERSPKAVSGSASPAIYAARATPTGFPAGADIQFPVLDGSVIDIANVLASGKYTVVDFYADWCVPCRALDKQFAKMLVARKDLALRKLNIVDWDSPLSRKYLGSVEGIPYVELYGPDGKKIGGFEGIGAAGEIESRLPKVP